MLYILPPPRGPNPPSPWESILCTANGSATTWKPPRVRLRSLPSKKDDGSAASQDDNMEANKTPKSLSECYFAGKGTALVLPAAEAHKFNRRIDSHGCNIRQHLQSIVDLLRPEETLKMAVKLESVHSSRIRYLVIVSRPGARGAEESCLLGIDCNDKTTVGLVLRVLADTAIRLDGDGGFSVSVCGRHHIFKPVSVQAMWSALQTLHKVSSKAREHNYFQGGLSHTWVTYYEERIESDRSCLNEWHAMDNLESKRPPSPDSIRTKPTEREETERVIRATLKEIMMSVDLDEVTSKYIRTRLEDLLDMDLGEYKSFIDQEMLTILGQMDAPTEIFEHVYLGSEWNASNYEELQRNGVGHILNVTQEIDNFFPGTFNYYNVRVCDDEKTDLLKYWDDTFKYISHVKLAGSKVLVHCKMGVSRSASVVIAYAMKAYNWDFQTAMHHVKEKRTCIKPNTNFLSQLETYQGILDAMKNKEKLQRSKSETNLKEDCVKLEKIPPGGEPTPIVQALPKMALSGQDLRSMGTRPKSWSPEAEPRTEKAAVSVSLEDLTQKPEQEQARHVLMPCDNGESYSVSPNQILHLPGGQSVKERVIELESNKDDKSATSSCSTSDSCDSHESSVVSDVKTVWTSSTIVKNLSESDLGEEREKRKEDDPFSNQVDRVFAREEKKQQRISTVTPVEEPREAPSRQSSWSSYDSAVVLVGLSRHSSWGSGDTRAIPSRNSSWGSYDLRPGVYPDDAPFQSGTVRRTKQKLEENTMTKSSSSETLFDEERPAEAVTPSIRIASDEERNNSWGSYDAPFQSGTVRRTKQKLEENTMAKSSSSETLFDEERPAEAVNERVITATIKIPVEEKEVVESRLSVSAPESSSMELAHDCALSRSSSQKGFPVETRSGIVRNLKKEFEAKVKSVPSSPVSAHVEKERVEEMNFKNLLGIFESKQEAQVIKRVRSGKASAPKNGRYSWRGERGPERVPPLPVVRNAPPSLVASVIASANKKQQQFGKSHPLARLTIKPRHNNPLYNTM